MKYLVYKQLHRQVFC